MDSVTFLKNELAENLRGLVKNMDATRMPMKVFFVKPALENEGIR